MRIQNIIYIGDFGIINFFGDFKFNLKSQKVRTDSSCEFHVKSTTIAKTYFALLLKTLGNNLSRVSFLVCVVDP